MTRFAGDGNPVPTLGDYALISVAGIPELPAQWRGGYWQPLVAGVGNFSTCQVIGTPRPLEFRPVNKVELVVT